MKKILTAFVFAILITGCSDNDSPPLAGTPEQPILPGISHPIIPDAPNGGCEFGPQAVCDWAERHGVPDTVLARACSSKVNQPTIDCTAIEEDDTLVVSQGPRTMTAGTYTLSAQFTVHNMTLIQNWRPRGQEEQIPCASINDARTVVKVVGRVPLRLHRDDLGECADHDLGGLYFVDRNAQTWLPGLRPEQIDRLDGVHWVIDSVGGSYSRTADNREFYKRIKPLSEWLFPH